MSLWPVFAVFAFFNAVTGNLTAVYPMEVFPTDVRATERASPERSAGSAPPSARSCCRDLHDRAVLFAPETTGRSLSHTARAGALAGALAGAAPA